MINLIRTTKLITKFVRGNKGTDPWTEAIFQTEIRGGWFRATFDKASTERLHDAGEIRHRDDY